MSSETCAFELMGAEYVRDLEPGEMVIINESGVQSVRPFGAQVAHRCVFEWIYFARPDSTIDGRSVYRARERMGRRLARRACGAGRRRDSGPRLGHGSGDRLLARERASLTTRG